MTKKPRTFVQRFNPCTCHAILGCEYCNHGYRTEYVPLADAILEVEEKNARQYLESVKQQQDDNEDERCGMCGCRESLPSPDGPACAKCGHGGWSDVYSSKEPDASPTVGNQWTQLMRHIEPGVAEVLLKNICAIPGPHHPDLTSLADMLIDYLGKQQPGPATPPTVGKSPHYLKACHVCGGTTFYMYQDGPVHCAGCGIQLLKEN